MDSPRHTFPRSHRLSGKLQFARVFEAKVRHSQGPFTVYALPNQRDHSRLGLSISRRVGIAIRRTRIKRMLREAYRLSPQDLPNGYDWVIVVRPHEPLTIAGYIHRFSSAATKLHAQWQRRQTAAVPLDAPPLPRP